MSVQLTQRQHAAVDARGSAVLVVASAGSGKTEVLVRRCVSILSDRAHRCSPEKLLAMTFTRAAAAELRGRLQSQLRAAREAARGAQRAFLEHQSTRLHDAEVGTIDSWAQRLVRTHSAALGLDPQFGVLAPADEIGVREECLDALCDSVADDDGKIGRDAAWWLSRLRVARIEALRDAVRRTYEFQRQLIDPETFFARARAEVDAPAPDQLARGRAQLADALRGDLLAYQQVAAEFDCGPSGRAIRDAHVAQIGAWIARCDGDALDAIVQELAAVRWVTKGCDAADVARVRALQQDVFKPALAARWMPASVAPYLIAVDDVARAARLVLTLTQRLDALIAERKRQLARYGFADVTQFALRVLTSQDHASTSSEIDAVESGALDHVLVDEVQDTSALQMALVDRLVAQSGAQLCLVGDVKQSIYGFRHAAPGIFQQKIQLAEPRIESRTESRSKSRAGTGSGDVTAPAVIRLTESFRAHPKLVDPLNRIFRALFDMEVGGAPFGDVDETQAARTPEPANATLDSEPRVSVTLIPEERGQTPDETEGGPDESGSGRATGALSDVDEELFERIEWEARAVVPRIRALLSTGRVRDRRSGALRAIEPADVVILLRSAARNADRVAQMLRRSGLPAVAEGRDSILDVLEVQDVLNVLRLLVNRRDDISLAALLRGPFVALADQTLFDLRRDYPADCMLVSCEAFVAEAPRDEVHSKLAAVLDQIDRWQTAMRVLDTAALMDRVIQGTQAEMHALRQPDGMHRRACVLALRDLAATELGAGGVAEFLARLDAYAAQGLAPEVSTSAPGRAIRVMTIHASKGLEFPVALLLGAGSRFNREDERGRILTHPEVGIGVRWSDHERQMPVATFAHEKIARRQRGDALSEEMRLLYVACTRAAEVLHIVGHMKEAEQRADSLSGSPRGQVSTLERQLASSMLDWVMKGVAAAGLSGTNGPRVAVDCVRRGALPALRYEPLDLQPAGSGDALPDERAEQAWRVTAERSLMAEAQQEAARRGGHGSWGLPAVVSPSSLKQAHDAAAPAAAAAPLEPVRFERQRVAEVITPAHAPDGAATGSSFDPVPISSGRSERSERGPRDTGLVDAAFDAAGPDDAGRLRGLATHQVMEHIDFGALESAEALERELARLVASGVVESADLERISRADLLWFGATPRGRMLARPAKDRRVLREVPVTYGLPVGSRDPKARTLLRGVIDLLILSKHGLELVDYKTDVMRDSATRAARIAMYQLQLQLYGQAAAAIWSQPVVSAELVFLDAREAVSVEPRVHDLSGLLASQAGGG